MRSKFIKIIIPVIATAVFVAYFTLGKKIPETMTETTSTEVNHRPQQLKDSLTGYRLSDVERRIKDLESDKPEKEPVEAVDDAESSNEGFNESNAPGPTAEEFVAKAKEEFESDPVDSLWAPKAESMLFEDLSLLGKQFGFRVVDTECRSSKCVADVSFENYGKADSSAMMLAQFSGKMNCATKVSIPEPEDVNSEYTTTVFYDSCRSDEDL
ncbi:MAG: hypothetical protein JXR76_28805 [Deltaproteobacteria bacterium]|nr:hypothetical protein [Deltaproteobacteria bacterium]